MILLTAHGSSNSGEKEDASNRARHGGFEASHNVSLAQLG